MGPRWRGESEHTSGQPSDDRDHQANTPPRMHLRLSYTEAPPDSAARRVSPAGPEFLGSHAPIRSPVAGYLLLVHAEVRVRPHHYGRLMERPNATNNDGVTKPMTELICASSTVNTWMANGA